MKIEIECPTDFQGSVVGNLTSRRGMVVGTEVSGPICRIEGKMPLSETFGYSTDLRSMTQGQGSSAWNSPSIVACPLRSSARSSPPANCKPPKCRARGIAVALHGDDPWYDLSPAEKDTLEARLRAEARSLFAKAIARRQMQSSGGPRKFPAENQNAPTKEPIDDQTNNYHRG